MVRDEDWKFILFEGFRPQLFDMKNDPNELQDLGGHTDYEHVCREMSDKLFEWIRRRKFRSTLSNNEIANRTGTAKERGYYFGIW